MIFYFLFFGNIVLHRRTLGERVTAALVRFASKSDEGIGDERVPISILTCQIRWPLPDFGSPPAYFPSGSGRGISLVFFRGSWHRKLWGNRPLSFAPSMRSWWRWSLVPWPCWVSTGPAERFVEPQRGKLEERFLQFKMSPSHRSLPFPPICTLRCRGLGENLSRPVSSSLPQITMVMWGGRERVTERCRGWNRRSRAICPPIWHRLWRLRPCPPSRCEHHRHWWARDTWQQVRLVHACTPCQCCRRTRLTCSKS